MTVLNAAQQLLPPALLSYFFFAWQITTFEIPPYISHELSSPFLARIYAVLPTTLIAPITALYLRLYFLPSTQSVPPRDPPASIRRREVVFECLSPGEADLVRLAAGSGTPTEADSDHHGTRTPGGTGSDYRGTGTRTVTGTENGTDSERGAGTGTGTATGIDGGRAGTRIPDTVRYALVNRCWKGRCQGRWKPARARHCSQCGVCRAGFDHHCPIFANCLTAAHLPTFILLLLLTPPSTVLLSLPLYIPVGTRALAAWRFARADPGISARWFDWTGSWVVAGGPVGRVLGGVVLGWRALDRRDAAERGAGPHSPLRLAVGAMVAFGIVLALICAGLAWTSINLILQGQLTVDRGRAQMHARARAAIAKLVVAGKQVPAQLGADERSWAMGRYFWVPLGRREGRYGDNGAGDSGADIGAEAGDGDTSGDGNAIDRRGHGGRGGDSDRAGNSDSEAAPCRGVIVEWDDTSTALRHAYDRGPTANWELVMGPGVRWLLPWNVILNRVGLAPDQLYNWPVAPEVDSWLKDRAALEGA